MLARQVLERRATGVRSVRGSACTAATWRLQHLQIVQLPEHVLRALDRAHVRSRLLRPLSAASSSP